MSIVTSFSQKGAPLTITSAQYQHQLRKIDARELRSAKKKLAKLNGK